MKSVFLSFVGVIVAVLSASTAMAADDVAQKGGTFVVATTLGELDSYDCHGATSLSSLYRLAPHYSTLLKVDAERFPEIVGDLAESWKVSQDGRTYEFRLHPNVAFHDGSALSSADIKATYERLRNPPEGVVSARRDQLRDVIAIETPDPRTIVFRLSKPNASMLTMFASPWNCVYSAKKLAEDSRYYVRNVMGTGPFRFVRHDAGAEWLAERSDKYFIKGLPRLDGIRIQNMTATAAVNAMSAGQLHMILGSVTEAEAERVVSMRGDKVRMTGPINSMTLFAVALNTTRPALSDVRVRRALNLAIDRRAGSEQLRRITYVSGFGGFLRSGSAFARSDEELKNVSGYKPDMAANRAEAKRLLAEAGHSDLTLTYINRQAWAPLGIFLIDQWRQIGVTVNQEIPEPKLFFERSRNGNFDVALDAFAIYADEPELQLSRLVSFSKNPPNISRLDDSEYDELYERQLRATDANERKKIVRQIEDRIYERPSIMPLFWLRRYSVEDVGVQGTYENPSFYTGLDHAKVWLRK